MAGGAVHKDTIAGHDGKRRGTTGNDGERRGTTGNDWTERISVGLLSPVPRKRTVHSTFTCLIDPTQQHESKESRPCITLSHLFEWPGVGVQTGLDAQMGWVSHGAGAGPKHLLSMTAQPVRSSTHPIVSFVLEQHTLHVPPPTSMPPGHPSTSRASRAQNDGYRRRDGHADGFEAAAALAPLCPQTTDPLTRFLARAPDEVVVAGVAPYLLGGGGDDLLCRLWPRLAQRHRARLLRERRYRVRVHHLVDHWGGLGPGTHLPVPFWASSVPAIDRLCHLLVHISAKNDGGVSRSVPLRTHYARLLVEGEYGHPESQGTAQRLLAWLGTTPGAPRCLAARVVQDAEEEDEDTEEGARDEDEQVEEEDEDTEENSDDHHPEDADSDTDSDTNKNDDDDPDDTDHDVVGPYMDPRALGASVDLNPTMLPPPSYAAEAAVLMYLVLHRLGRARAGTEECIPEVDALDASAILREARAVARR